jgi:hypothetical protein
LADDLFVTCTWILVLFEPGFILLGTFLTTRSHLKSVRTGPAGAAGVATAAGFAGEAAPSPFGCEPEGASRCPQAELSITKLSRTLKLTKVLMAI